MPRFKIQEEYDTDPIYIVDTQTPDPHDSADFFDYVVINRTDSPRADSLLAKTICAGLNA